MFSISYNPLTRQYDLVEAGLIVESFPAGDIGRQSAREHAIKANDPKAYAAAFFLIHDIYRNKQEAHGRIWSAAEIVAEGRISGMNPAHDTPNALARINPTAGKNPLARPEGDAYLIFSLNGRYRCQCPDFEFDAAPKAEGGQPLCKHILAYKLTKIMQRPLPPAPIIQADPEPLAVDHTHWQPVFEEHARKHREAKKAEAEQAAADEQHRIWHLAAAQGIPEEERPGKPIPRIRRRMPLDEVNALLFD